MARAFCSRIQICFEVYRITEFAISHVEEKLKKDTPSSQVSSLLLSSGKILPFSSEMPAVEAEETSIGMLKTEISTPDHLPEGDMGFRRSLEEQCPSSDMINDGKVEVRMEKPAVLTPGSCYANCPNGWIGFGNKCFYFSEGRRNWTLSQSYCMEQAANLARFDSLEELNFLKRYGGYPCYWIGLHRESLQHPWKWIDNSDYNNMYVFIALFLLLFACVAVC
ncbi:hypothetical protein U0070_002905 [Myodes glareolus]|uniref:C-type lectin domain-containing protein n=1 Tax=Myodes glareolus TaxID=447135 RepID=A0AAW0HBR4_MYOGA